MVLSAFVVHLISAQLNQSHSPCYGSRILYVALWSCNTLLQCFSALLVHWIVLTSEREVRGNVFVPWAAPFFGKQRSYSGLMCTTGKKVTDFPVLNEKGAAGPWCHFWWLASKWSRFQSAAGRLLWLTAAQLLHCIALHCIATAALLLQA